jgi:hypothetical protein
MKIAICFSGQPRTWEKCYNSWFKFIEKIKQIYNATDVDIFCHAWNFNTLPNELLHAASRKGLSSKWYDITGEIITEDELSRFLSILKPKVHLFENEEKSKTRKDETANRAIFEKNLYGKCMFDWTASQFYGIMQSAHLKKKYEFENGFRYDICIRMRYDLFFNDAQLEEYVYKEMCLPMRNTIYSCHTNRDDSIGYPWWRLGDIFWYANSVSFDRLCDFYRFLPIMGHNTFQKRDTLVESALYHYAKMLRLSVRSLPFLDLKIVRPSDHLELKKNFGLSSSLTNCEII